MDQDPKPGERSFMRELVPDWRPARRQVLWTIRIVLGLVVVLTILTLVGWPFDVTLWDWLDLLIIPVVLAIGGFLFTRSENQRTQQTADKERTLDREIADGRRQDDTLQAYLDGMSQLLTDRDQPLHRAQPGDSLSTVARARTLTVLGSLDGGRKRSVMQFLYESGLIYKEHTLLNESDLIERRHNIVSLQQADLSGADLERANLSEADLERANLSQTDLRVANLERVNLLSAYLREANLERANLRGANLERDNLLEADLRGADLFEANLRGAYLFSTNLLSAYLRGADLSGAHLRAADLSHAKGVTNEQLSTARSLEGATMPDGQTLKSYDNPDGPTFEEWLKSKGRAEG